MTPSFRALDFCYVDLYNQVQEMWVSAWSNQGRSYERWKHLGQKALLVCWLFIFFIDFLVRSQVTSLLEDETGKLNIYAKQS